MPAMPRKPKASTNRLPPLSGWRLAVKNALEGSPYNQTSLARAIGRRSDYVADIWRPHPEDPGSYRKKSFKAQEAAAIEQLLHLRPGTCAREEDDDAPPPEPILRAAGRPAVERRNPASRALIEESLRLGVLLSQVSWTDERFALAAGLIEEYLAKTQASHETPDIRRMKLELEVRRAFQK
jgi:hypothetical protein